MADLSKTIEIIFEGTDNLGPTLASFAQNADLAANSVLNITGPLASLTGSLLSMEATAASAGAAFLALATTTAGSFNDSFREISSLITDAEADLGSYRDEVLNYASTSSFAFDDVTASYYRAISAGYDYNEATALLVSTEKLAIAGRTDLSEATGLTVNAMNAYGAATNEATAYTDTLWRMAQLGDTNLTLLSGSLGRVTTTAASAGVSLEEVGTAIVVMTQAGLNTEQSVTALNQILTAIIDPSKEARTTMEALGISYGVTALETQGLSGWLQTLIEKTDGNKDAMTGIITSSEAVRAAFALTADSGQKWNDVLALMLDKNGAVEASYIKMADSFDLVNQRIINAVRYMLVEAGTPLEERWAEIGAAISKIFLNLGESVDDGTFAEIYKLIDDFINRAIAALNQVATNIGPALAQVDFSGIIAAIREFGSVWEAALGGGADLTSVEGLRNAIQTIVNLFEQLTKATTGISETYLIPVVKAVGALGSAAGDANPAVSAFVGHFLGISSTTDMVLRFGGGITDLATSVGVLALAFPAATSAMAAFVTAAAPFVAAFKWTDTVDTATESAQQLALQLVGIDKATAATIKTQADLQRAIDEGRIIWDQSTNTLRSAKDGVDGVGTSSADAANKVKDLGAAAKETGTAAGETADKTGTLAKATEDTATKVQVLRGTLTTTESSIRLYGVGASSAADDTKKAHTAISDLANDSSLKNLTFDWELNVANIEANAKIAMAAVTEMGDVFKESTTLLGELFGYLVNPDITSDIRQRIIDQIEEENRIRQETFEIIKAVNQASIDYYNAKTEALKSDKALITIDGGNLQPHLEAFMWEILNTIQVRVNEDGLEMLLGMA